MTIARSVREAVFLCRDCLDAFGPSRLFLKHTAATSWRSCSPLTPLSRPRPSLVLFYQSSHLVDRDRDRMHAPARCVISAGRWCILRPRCCRDRNREARAAAWLGWIHRLPVMPSKFRERVVQDNEVMIAVIGGSSALGVPYEDWVSVGAIVSELERAISLRQFRLEILAEKGATLEAMHLKLASLRHRPDALIVYSGHNEFLPASHCRTGCSL